MGIYKHEHHTIIKSMSVDYARIKWPGWASRKPVNRESEEDVRYSMHENLEKSVLSSEPVINAATM